MQSVLLARHGETRANRSDVLHGRTETGLTDKGIRQAENLAENLKHRKIEKIYASDLERASKTAEIVTEKINVPVEKDSRLRERDFGKFENSHKKERRKALDHADQLDNWRPEGGENLGDLRDRVREVVEEMQEEVEDTGMIIAHSWINRALIFELLDAEPGHAHQLDQENTCLNELRKTDFRGWRLKKLNNTSHVE